VSFLNISIFIPLLPMTAALFIFVLLASFNRTINRLTKPVSALIGLSLLGSASISFLYYLEKIEGELFLSDYLQIFEKTNLVIHVNLLNEKILIFFSLIMIIVIGFSFYKLPRRKGYVSLMIIIGLISSLIMFSVLLVDFSILI
tara:strand:- start:47 stop:478 length:432 start_codon:yes stop_codon:yes gene_type:complete